MPRYIVDLNNCKYLQKQASLHVLTWGEGQEGNLWVMTCKINDVPRGVGKHVKKGSAKEEAARQTLIQLGLLSESE
ncbi:hypothetical protein C8Q73DRAFT_788161 [Cubamyces lactineus]|nr:hypothetical protein C8Q73DRAFT_788161 [Cubamyces lactineus]